MDSLSLIFSPNDSLLLNQTITEIKTRLQRQNIKDFWIGFHFLHSEFSFLNWWLEPPHFKVILIFFSASAMILLFPLSSVLVLWPLDFFLLASSTSLHFFLAAAFTKKSSASYKTYRNYMKIYVFINKSAWAVPEVRLGETRSKFLWEQS